MEHSVSKYSYNTKGVIFPYELVHVFSTKTLTLARLLFSKRVVITFWVMMQSTVGVPINATACSISLKWFYRNIIFCDTWKKTTGLHQLHIRIPRTN